MMYLLRKWLICSWLHNRWRCYPDVGGKGLKGGWHCSECHPCSEGLMKLLEEIGRDEAFE